MSLQAYLPYDRRRALAEGVPLPDRAVGSALFADISGFSRLTETLRRLFGARQGAEELTNYLNEVYTALTNQVRRYGGSVISFAGDAITCWFDEQDGHAPRRAVACGLALQAAMRPFRRLPLTAADKDALSLTIKVSVATGPARRFVVGDPAYQQFDALAGAAVSRMALGQALAQKGEALVDKATHDALAPALRVSGWRTDPRTGESFAIAQGLTGAAPAVDYQGIGEIDPAVLKPWLHTPLYEWERADHQSFLTDFRPCVALFIRFAGIDYDSDMAGRQLDAFVSEAQATADRYNGSLLHLIIGDKGSYLYLNFGAFSVHEDDARRALKTAVAIRKAAQRLDWLASLQMGLAQGVMWTGAYGGPTRRAYSAYGEDVNIAARLMQTAAPGEILVASRVQHNAAADFAFAPRPPLPLKDKADPLSVFELLAERQPPPMRLQEPSYPLPMVGRRAELAAIAARLDLARQGEGQVVAIVAEAGLGKSRLAAEVIGLARQKGFVGYGGACQSDGIHAPYLAWRSILSAFLEVDPAAPLASQLAALHDKIAAHAPHRLEAAPLLGVPLGLPIADNDFTADLEPRIRQSALHALLEDCFKTVDPPEPTLIVIEDFHWIDPLSRDLLVELANALTARPICFLLVYRPAQLEANTAARLDLLPALTKIELHELSDEEAEQAVQAKLAQLYPDQADAVAPALVATALSRAQGNPFYLEELLNFWRDRNLDPREAAALERVDLPDSLHTLILSRIDQLSERQKTTLRVASVVGRLFYARWLTGYYPALGSLSQVKGDLDRLNALDITLLEKPEPDLIYLFKHTVTHEVAYRSLPFATRAKLHEWLARFLEDQIEADVALPDRMPAASALDLLAFHYGRSANVAKQKEYLRKAAETARKNFANAAALAYYDQLAPLLTDAAERTSILLERGATAELMGQYEAAEADYRAALELAERAAEKRTAAAARSALGKLSRLRGDYDAALDWLSQAGADLSALNDQMALGQTLIEMGMVLWRKGVYRPASSHLHEGMGLARVVGDAASAALALNNLGNVALAQGEWLAARGLYEESLALRRDLGNKLGVSSSLNNLGLVAFAQGDMAASRAFLAESLTLKREMGYKYGIAESLGNLGYVALAQGDTAAASALLWESLGLRREMGNKYGMAFTLLGLGLAKLTEPDDTALAQAQAYIIDSLRLRQEMGEPLPLTSSLIGMAGLLLQKGNGRAAVQLLGAAAAALTALNASMELEMRDFHARTVDTARAALGEADFTAAWSDGERLSLDEAADHALACATAVAVVT